MKMGIQDCIDFLIERGYEVRGLSNEDILSMVEELQHEGDPDTREVEWEVFAEYIDEDQFGTLL